MKKLSIVLGLVLWSLFAAVALPLQPPLLGTPTLTVPAKDHPLTHFPTSWVTWNLQWFPGQTPRAKEPAREKHEKAVQETLQNINPQVAILEEVMDEGALGRVISDHPWRAVSNFQRAKDEDEKLPPQNVAIASQIPWREVWEVDFHALPLTPDRPVRGFLGAEFSDRGGRSLTVYAVHLKSNRGGREASGERRERAVDYLRWDWHRRGLDPHQDAILVAGDFNCSLRNPEFAEEQTIRRLLKEGWISAAEEIPWPEAATVKADPFRKYPPADFDHILLSPGWIKMFGDQQREVRVVRKGDVPSDHFPVELKYFPPKVAPESTRPQQRFSAKPRYCLATAHTTYDQMQNVSMLNFSGGRVWR